MALHFVKYRDNFFMLFVYTFRYLFCFLMPKVYATCSLL